MTTTLKKEGRPRRFLRRIAGVALLFVLLLLTWFAAPFIYLGAALVSLWNYAGGKQLAKSGFNAGQEEAVSLFDNIREYGLPRCLLTGLLFRVCQLGGFLLGIITFPLSFLVGKTAAGFGRLRTYALTLVEPEPKLVLAATNGVVPDNFMGVKVTRSRSKRIAKAPRARRPSASPSRIEETGSES